MANNESSMTDEAFWDVHAAAAYLNVSESWVYQQCARGHLPHRKFGGLLRFQPSELRAWAEDARRSPARVLSMGKKRV